MKYIKMTIQYFTAKKLFSLMLLALIPACLLAVMSSNNSIANYMVNINNIDTSSFSSIHNVISDLEIGKLWLYPLIIAFATLFLSQIYGIVERDMHVGDFNLKGVMRRFNNNGLTIAFALLILFFSIWLMGLAVSALFLLSAVTTDGALTFILSIIVIILLGYLLIVTLMMFLLIVPIILNTGQKLSACIKDSIIQVREIHFKTVIAIIFPFLIFQVLTYVERAISLDFSLIVDIVINAFSIVYYITLILVIYYDLTGLERADLNPSSRLFN